MDDGNKIAIIIISILFSIGFIPEIFNFIKRKIFKPKKDNIVLKKFNPNNE